MNSKNKKNNPSWVSNFTDTENKLDIEPFSKPIVEYNPSLIAFNGYICMADRPQGSKKIAYALRIEEEINTDLELCQGSKNAVINALLKYAIADLKAKKQTLTTD